jgi:hypothetical protein
MKDDGQSTASPLSRGVQERQTDTSQSDEGTFWVLLPQTQGAMAVALALAAIKSTFPLLVVFDAVIAVTMTWLCINSLIKVIRGKPDER